ncbi:protein FAM186A [Myotis yumanensis]|uniref:protein FAM186A n=1 Tax=Myotis yumanensis TaxID=159337 RepID=UPI0038D05A29
MKNETHSESDSEKKAVDYTIQPKADPEASRLETPASVQDVMSKIEQAQLLRAREGINIQLSDIKKSVQGIVHRYTFDEFVETGRKVSLSDYKKQRTKVLEKVSFCANSADIKEKILVHILAWLKEWNAILSDMTEVDIDEHHHCIAQMEILPKTFKAIEGNVKRLSVIGTSLLEDKKKEEEKKMSRKALWKSWKERVIKRPATVHALTPNQMIGDEFATNTKVSEIQAMLQELIDTTMFNKLENNAINYIASTIENLSKALSSLNNEAKVINLHPEICISEESEKELSLQIIQELSEENERLQGKLQEAEEKCEQFIKFKTLPTSTLKVLYEFSPKSSMGFSMTDEAASMDNTLMKEFENRMDGAQRKETQGSVLKWDSASSHTAQVEMTPDLIEQQFLLLEKNPKIPSKDLTEDKISLKKGDIYQKGWTDEYQSQKRKITKAPYEFETSRSNLSKQTSKQIISKTKVDYDLDLQSQQKMSQEIQPLSIAQRKTSQEIQPFSIARQKTSQEIQPLSIARRKTSQEIQPLSIAQRKTSQEIQPLSIAQQKTSQEIQPLSIAKSKSFIESKSQHVLSNFPSTDTKSQGGKSGTSSKWERLRKYKIAYILEKCQVISDHKKKSTTELMAKESKSVMSFQAVPFGSIQPDESSEKVKIEGKEHQISSEITTSKKGKTEEEDTSVFTKKGKSQELVESQSKTSESTTVLGSPEGKSEQANLDEFHNAIMSFLKEKIDNTENPLDKKTVPEEELLLKKAEVEKLGIIKAKMEEYFQNVARAVAKILRKYNDIKIAGQIREKQMKQSTVSFMPGLHLQEPISPKSEISSLLSSESMDPVIQNLTQEILTEIVAPVISIAGKDHMEKEKQRQEEYLPEVQGESLNMNLKHQLQERNLWKMGYKRIKKDLQQLQPKEGKQEQQKQDQWQEEVWEQHQKQRMQKQTEQDEKQKGMEEEEQQKQKQQRLEAWRQKMKEQGVSLEKEEGQQMEQLQKELESSWKEEEEKQKPKRKGRDDESQWYKKAKEQLKIKEERPEELENVLSSASIRLTPRWKNTWKRALLSRTKKEFHVNLADEKHSEPVIPPSSTQFSSPGPFSIPGQFPTKSIAVIHEEAESQGITLSPEQAQAQGITLTPSQALAQGITLTPSQALAQGITLTPQQALAQGITLTPSQALAQGITLTPQQAMAQGITLTPQQAMAQGITLTPQQAQAQGITLTPSQALAQGITLTPQQAMAQGITLTPSQALAQGITLTPQQAMAQGITLTPSQALAQGITLTPQQAMAQGITLTPSQALAQGITLTSSQALAQGITLTPSQALAQGITLTPQQAQAQGITLTPSQALAQGITLTSSQALAQGITLTPQQAMAQGITLTPQQAQAQGITLTPQQAQAQGITLTPQQAQAQGITLTPQQAQAQGVTLTPQQAQAQGITLTPQQAQALDITLTPQQAQAQGITLTPQQAQAQGITLTPQQAQAQGITLTPQQAQAQGITLTPQQALEQGITLTPQQAQALDITLTPQQAQAQGITLTPQQAQAQGITLTPQQAQAQGITLTPQQALEQGITLTPQQAQALDITLTPQQAQALDITLTPQQAQALDITLTPQQAQELDITLTPQQAQALDITLTPQQTQAQGITLTPQQAQALDITLTPQQTQALGITLTHEQFKALMVTLTPEKSQGLGVTLTHEQVQALRAPVILQQEGTLRDHITPIQGQTLKAPAQAHDMILTPEQSQAMQIPVTTQQAQILGVPIAQGQEEALGVTITPQQAEAEAQAQALMFTLTPENAQIWGITHTNEQAPAVGITLTPEQKHVLEVPLTFDQAQALETPLTAEQAWKLGVAITPEMAQKVSHTLFLKQGKALGIGPTYEQAQSFGSLTLNQARALRIPDAWLSIIARRHEQSLGAPLTSDKAHVLGPPLTREQVQPSGKPFQESKTPLLSGQSTTSRTRWPLVPSALIDEKTPGFKVSPTSLQTSGFPFTQAPFVSGKSQGKGSFGRELPSSKQTLVSKGQLTPVKFLAPEVPPTPGKLSVSGTPPTLGQPLISGIPPASSQIPSLWAPLFPGKPLIPGAPSVPGELMESGLSTSEQPQAFQLPTACEQSPYLQAPSTLGELPAPQTFPGQAFPLRISPTPGHPPPPRTPSTPGKPPKDLSLKSKSALVHPGAPSFKVPQAPFTTKKFQISEVSDTSEEIQELRDSFTMEQLRTVQSYLTKYRTPVSQTPYIDEGALPTRMKPITSLPPLTTQLPKRSQIAPSEWDWKSRFPPISKPCVLTSVSGTKKLKMMIPSSSFQELKEQRYFVDVKAQRKNLILLNQTTETSGHPSELHTTARNLIIETLHTDTVRLGYLFRKYIAYRLIQRARNNIIKRILAIQNSGRGYETQNLYIMLNRIDGYQKKMMGVWTEKQKSLEQKRNQCLRKMMFLFSQLQDKYQLNLSQPVPLLIDKKQKPTPTKFIQQPFLELLMKEDRKSDIFKKFRQQEDQMAAIWNADQSTTSYPIAEKTSLHSLWAQLGGYPPIPMLLQLDVQSSFRKSLASIQSQ